MSELTPNDENDEFDDYFFFSRHVDTNTLYTYEHCGTLYTKAHYDTNTALVTTLRHSSLTEFIMVDNGSLVDNRMVQFGVQPQQPHATPSLTQTRLLILSFTLHNHHESVYVSGAGSNLHSCAFM